MKKSTLSVLIVDDEKEILEVIKAMLEDKVDIIFTASNVLQALEILKTTKIDKIISDFNMPHKNGNDLYQEIFNYNIGTIREFIIMGNEKLITNQNKLVPVKSIQKPFSEDELLLLLKNCPTTVDKTQLKLS